MAMSPTQVPCPKEVQSGQYSSRGLQGIESPTSTTTDIDWNWLEPYFLFWILTSICCNDSSYRSQKTSGLDILGPWTWKKLHQNSRVFQNLIPLIFPHKFLPPQTEKNNQFHVPKNWKNGFPKQQPRNVSVSSFTESRQSSFSCTKKNGMVSRCESWNWEVKKMWILATPTEILRFLLQYPIQPTNLGQDNPTLISPMPPKTNHVPIKSAVFCFFFAGLVLHFMNI